MSVAYLRRPLKDSGPRSSRDARAKVRAIADRIYADCSSISICVTRHVRPRSPGHWSPGHWSPGHVSDQIAGHAGERWSHIQPSSIGAFHRLPKRNYCGGGSSYSLAPADRIRTDSVRRTATDFARGLRSIGARDETLSSNDVRGAASVEGRWRRKNEMSRQAANCCIPVDMRPWHCEAGVFGVRPWRLQHIPPAS